MRAQVLISDRGGQNIPEGGTTLRRVYMQKFRNVWLQEEKELKMAGESNKNAIWALLVFLSVHIARLTFHENLLIEQETSVRWPH